MLFLSIVDRSPQIVRGKENHRETHVSMALELLDDGSPLVRLLVQYNWFKAQTEEEPSNSFSCAIVVAVNNEYLAGVSGACLKRFRCSLGFVSELFKPFLKASYGLLQKGS